MMGGAGAEGRARELRARRLARAEQEEREEREEREEEEEEERRRRRASGQGTGKRGSLHRQLTRSGSNMHVASLSHRSCFLLGGGSAVRRGCLCVVVHPRFETFILAMIGAYAAY